MLKAYTKILPVLLFFISSISFAQNSKPNDVMGFQYVFENNKYVKYLYDGNRIVVKSKTFPKHNKPSKEIINFHFNNKSRIRYSLRDSNHIGYNCSESGGGNRSLVSWTGLNSRATCYADTNNSVIWEHESNNYQPSNYVDITSNGNLAVWSFNDKIHLFDGFNGSEVWNFNLYNWTEDSLHVAGPSAITRNGEIIIAAVNHLYSVFDTSYILGFNSVGNVPLWCIKLPYDSIGGLNILGIKISGNDSLAIVNEYMKFYVIKTYTGEMIYCGVVNPYNTHNYGTQRPQGINADGSIIATINYYGYLRVYRWNGYTYSLLWEDQEPPNEYWSWMTAVDISYDGKKIAAGSKITIISNASYIGKVRYYETDRGSTPLWIHSDSGIVNYLSFSGNGKILCAATDGSLFTRRANNFFVYNTNYLTSNPVFAVNDSGSFYWCSASDDGITVIGCGKGDHSFVLSGKGIYYNLFIDTSANPIGITNNQNEIPIKYFLYQNYPNPFNPVTNIKFDIPKDGYVKIVLFDILGREVLNLTDEFKKAGSYDVRFDASNLSSGTYFYRIIAGDFTDTKKMILIK